MLAKGVASNGLSLEQKLRKIVEGLAGRGGAGTGRSQFGAGRRELQTFITHRVMCCFSALFNPSCADNTRDTHFCFIILILLIVLSKYSFEIHRTPSRLSDCIHRMSLYGRGMFLRKYFYQTINSTKYSF